MASARLEQISSHLSGTTSQGTQIGVKKPDDVVIVSCVRTPICRARKGLFKDTKHEYLLSVALKAVTERVNLDKSLVKDIVVGNVLPPGSGANLARIAMLHAGYPDKTSVMTVHRQCSSGLQAVTFIAALIREGTIDIGIGAGVESMSQFYGSHQIKKESLDQDMLASDSNIADCLMPMGIVSENVAQEFGVSREKQDKFSAESHKRAYFAQRNGLFKREIVPVTTNYIDDKHGGKVSRITVSNDDGIRPTTSAEGLAKLKPAFRKDGTTTAGNASQVSDGAAAVLLMKRSRAIELNLPILGKYIASDVYGVPPRINGIGPIYAIPNACAKANISPSDLDIIELNEAFASQAVYCIEKLGLSFDKVNPLGGAIAFGHPLGCTGARQVSTLLYNLIRTKKRIGAISMCIGSGMGMCSIFEAEF
ncbi:3-ketoacyl-CoA thiolase A, peroxisomal [Smittium culicis]|uniref:3-ketoacyl-CoA thiolase A, peroxisomal n=2 Tax=Smittium culicis TaxID=133412 RepID=A0A1R1XS01_9FUNG|nr:3-ketoacyl-CoA thiolase A, peroxisomal [Smittium culicis]